MCLSSDGVNCVAFDSKNPNILVSCSLDETIKMWDITSGSSLSTLRVDGSVLSLDFSPCGTKIAATSNRYPKYEIKMWDITSGSVVSTLSCGSPVMTIALKDKMIVAGCEDGKIKLFKLNESRDWGEIQPEPPLWGHRYVPSLSREHFLSCFVLIWCV